MCDSLVATRSHTAVDTTLFAKNSDRRAGECQSFVQMPAALHPRGATVRCTHSEIPQVAETYRVMGHSPWWVWGFEHGVNEHAVAIGNHSVFSREAVEETPGLIGMDLVRLGLERGRDAREALEVMAALIEAHGQGGSSFAPGEAGYHNSFLVADPEHAWVMETSGRRWAARLVQIWSLSNHLSIGSDWGIGSRDLESFARSEGWWHDDSRVDVARAYRNEHVPGVISEGRLRRSRELLELGRGLHDSASMMAALRDHAGAVAPPLDAETDDERRYTLCMHSDPVGTTTASIVAPLPRDRAVWPVWIGFGTPCTGIFLPVYLDGILPASVARASEDFDASSLWWTFQRLQESASTDFARAIPLVREGWAPVEEKIETERQRVESEARAAVIAGDDDRSAGLLGDFMARTAGEVQACAESLRTRIGA